GGGGGGGAATGGAGAGSRPPPRPGPPNPPPGGRARALPRPPCAGRRTRRSWRPGPAAAARRRPRRHARPPRARRPRRKYEGRVERVRSRRQRGERRGLHGFRHAPAQGPGLAPAAPRPPHLPLAPHRLQEAFELELERLGFGRRERQVIGDVLDALRAECLPPRLEPVEVAAALGQVEREVTAALEDAQLAGALA